MTATHIAQLDFSEADEAVNPSIEWNTLRSLLEHSGYNVYRNDSGEIWLVKYR